MDCVMTEPKKRKGTVGARTRYVRAKPRGWYPPSIVEDVIRNFCEGSASELQRRLERISEQRDSMPRKLSKQHLLGWRKRGQFPIEWVEHIQVLTRLPYSALIARTRPRS